MAPYSRLVMCDRERVDFFEYSFYYYDKLGILFTTGTVTCLLLENNVICNLFSVMPYPPV